MSDLAWEYPILMVVAVGFGVVLFSFIMRAGRQDPPKEPERECTRCKLRVVGKVTEPYRFCPFCGAAYPKNS